MTTDVGRPVGDNQNSLTMGPRGPIVFDDYLLFEKMAHFNRERIPERVVHAKGSGAYGTFTSTKPDMEKYTTAKVFETAGKKTPMLLRFSTVGGEKGSADYGARSARVCAEVLHGRRELGPGREQYAGVLYPRSFEVLGLYPYAEARSGDEPEVADDDVGLLVAVAGEPAPGDDSVQRSRDAEGLSPYEWIWQPYVLADQ